MLRTLSQALAAQFLGVGMAWLVGWLTGVVGWPLVWVASSTAAVLSRLIGQPRWWVPIHLVFLPAALGLAQLEFPAWLYLLAFLVLGLIFWGTVGGDVPLYLSSPAVCRALDDLVGREGAGRLAELGAGIGSVIVPLARKRPGLHIEAWERAPLPWLITRWRCRHLPNVRLHRQNFWQADLSAYDIVFAFLSPLPMPALGEKAMREMTSGSLLVSSGFQVPGWVAENVLTLPDRAKTRLYCYRIDAT
jgi:hypothetical protein